MTEHAQHARSKKKTENISCGSVRHEVRSNGKPLARCSCPTRNLSRRIPRISSLSCGGLAGFRPTTVHSKRGNSTTTTSSEWQCSSIRVILSYFIPVADVSSRLRPSYDQLIFPDSAANLWNNLRVHHMVFRQHLETFLFLCFRL